MRRWVSSGGHCSAQHLILGALPPLEEVVSQDSPAFGRTGPSLEWKGQCEAGQLNGRPRGQQGSTPSPGKCCRSGQLVMEQEDVTGDYNWFR